MLALLRYISLVLTLSALLTLYLTLLVTVPVQEAADLGPVPNGIKEVVGYSLRKQIEIESEEVACAKLEAGDEQDSKADAEGSRWTRVLWTDLFAFGVYYDDRLQPFRYLRVLGMIKGTWNRTLFCQIHLKDQTYYVTKAVRTDVWEKQWDVGDEDTFNPVLISCLLPDDAVPKSVRLNTESCQLGEPMLPIVEQRKIQAKPPLNQFIMTVCVKPLNFTKDISKHLMQWIEINKILGAGRFEIFVRRVPEVVKQMLQFYRKKLRRSFFVQSYQNVEEYFGQKPLKARRGIWQKRRNELMAYNDCLYRNLRSSHFVVPVDIDEIIVPKRFYTWQGALSHLFSSTPSLQEDFASFSAQNGYFLEDDATASQASAFFLRRTKRTVFSAEGESGKSFVSVRNSLTVFNHYALDPLRPGVRRTFFLPLELAQMNHYRRTCSPDLLPQCAERLSSPVRIVDTLISKYKAEFVENYGKTVGDFNVFCRRQRRNETAEMPTLRVKR